MRWSPMRRGRDVTLAVAALAHRAAIDPAARGRWRSIRGQPAAAAVRAAGLAPPTRRRIALRLLHPRDAAISPRLDARHAGAAARGAATRLWRLDPGFACGRELLATGDEPRPVHGRLDAGRQLIEADPRSPRCTRAPAAREGGARGAAARRGRAAGAAARRRGVARRGRRRRGRDVDLGCAPRPGRTASASPSSPGPSAPAIAAAATGVAPSRISSAPAAWRWATDAALKLRSLAPAPPAAGLIGEPLTRLFALLPGD